MFPSRKMVRLGIVHQVKNCLTLTSQYLLCVAKHQSHIKQRFAKAFFEDKLLAIKWLFFAGDVRGGLGERRLFRIGMEYLANNEKDIAVKLLKLIPEYTRWDNLAILLDTSLYDEVVSA